MVAGLGKLAVHNRGTHLAIFLDQIDVISISLPQKFGDIGPLLQTVQLARQRAFQTAFRMVFSHQTGDFECFANSSNISRESAHH